MPGITFPKVGNKLADIVEATHFMPRFRVLFGANLYFCHNLIVISASVCLVFNDKNQFLWMYVIIYERTHVCMCECIHANLQFEAHRSSLAAMRLVDEEKKTRVRSLSLWAGCTTHINPYKLRPHSDHGRAGVLLSHRIYPVI